MTEDYLSRSLYHCLSPSHPIFSFSLELRRVKHPFLPVLGEMKVHDWIYLFVSPCRRPPRHVPFLHDGPLATLVTHKPSADMCSKPTRV